MIGSICCALASPPSVGAGLPAMRRRQRAMRPIAMGVVILGEPFTPWLSAGTALLVAGLFVSSRAGR